MYLRLACLPFLLFSVFFQDPGDLFKRHYEEANRYHRARDYGRAENEFKAILGEAYQRLGKVYSAQGRYTDSVGPFESAVAISPTQLEGVVELSIAYFRTRQYQKSVDVLQRLIAANPQYAPAHHMLGKSYFMLAQFDKAAAEFETTLKLVPNDYDATYTLGLAFLKQRQVPQAKQLFQGMVDKLGNRPQLRVLIGRAYRETGFLPESIEEFNTALKLDPKFPRVHYYLGLTYLYKDGATRIADAMREFEIELAANPEEYFANFYLGILYIIERKWDPAATLLEKAASKQPNNPDPYFHLGQAYQGAGKHQQAADVLKKSIDLTPSLAHNDYQVTTAHYRLGQSLIKIGRTAEGQKELQTSADLKSKGFKLDEKKVGAFMSGGVLPAAEGADLVKAEGVVNETVALDPKIATKLKEDDPDIYYDLGVAHTKLAQYDAAAAAFSKSLEIDPDYYRAQDALDEAKEGVKRIRAGKKHQEDLLKKQKQEELKKAGASPSPED